MFKPFFVVLVALALVGLCEPVRAQAKDETKKLGPSGGDGGEEFADKQLPKGARIVAVKIHHGMFVDSVELLYKTAEGKEESLGRHGGNGGEEEVFKLGEGEFITGIKGKSGALIDSLAIVTNKRTSRICGGEGGDNEFDLKADGMEVIGFFGRSGDLIDRIGVVVRKKEAK